MSADVKPAAAPPAEPAPLAARADVEAAAQRLERMFELPPRPAEAAPVTVQTEASPAPPPPLPPVHRPDTSAGAGASGGSAQGAALEQLGAVHGR